MRDFEVLEKFCLDMNYKFIYNDYTGEVVIRTINDSWKVEQVYDFNCKRKYRLYHMGDLGKPRWHRQLKDKLRVQQICCYIQKHDTKYFRQGGITYTKVVEVGG
ncbi:hypothetical protein ACKQTC_04220 [Peptococcus simiae]|uniref:Uncharacterized protein n=1 Tax=Peptococcus simiae TaxID=1643805 RepID=A0ABW9GZM3_9FIRM